MNQLHTVLLAVFCLFAATPNSLATTSTNAAPTLNQSHYASIHRAHYVARHRRHRRGIGQAYKHAGVSAARGGTGFARHMSHGRPVRAGGALGRGMGGMGKGVGVGTARTGKKVGTTVKHATTP